MKRILSIILLVMFATTAVAGDNSIMFEFGVGFGDSGKTSYSKAERKQLDLSKCRNRNSGQMTYLGLRLRSDDVELHGAKWFHDTEIANCDRDNYAIGIGYVIDSEGKGTQGNDDYHVSWTPGFAYIGNTNWRMTDNWTMFNRFAVGFETNDEVDIELAINRYGSLYSNHGETFGTIGLRINDRVNNDPVQNTNPPSNPENPDDDDDDDDETPNGRPDCNSVHEDCTVHQPS
jgi:hypothetical protein